MGPFQSSFSVINNSVGKEGSCPACDVTGSHFLSNFGAQERRLAITKSQCGIADVFQHAYNTR